MAIHLNVSDASYCQAVDWRALNFQKDKLTIYLIILNKSIQVDMALNTRENHDS